VQQIDDSIPPVVAAQPVSQLITAQTAHADPALAPTEIGGPLVAADELPTGRQPPAVALIEPGSGPITMLGAGPVPRGQRIAAQPVAPTLPPYTAPGAPTMAGPGLRVVPGPTDSGSYGSYRTLAPRERNWKLLIAVVSAAAVIGSLTVFVAMGGGDKPRRTDVAASAPDHVDAAQEAPPPPKLVDAAEARGQLVDAPEPVVAAADAAEPVAADAAVVEVILDAAPIDEITALYNGGRFTAAVAACVRSIERSRGIDADHAGLCTLAACNVRDATHARLWLARVVAGKRPKLVAQCRDLGVDLSPPKRPPPTPPPTPPPPRGSAAVDPCEADPASCQH
jgi:hypothetical protein